MRMSYLEIFKNIQRQEKRNYCYLGIKRADFPKWIGWKLIDHYKSQGIKVSNVTDPNLDVMVENFYLMMFLREEEELKNDERRSD